ncbi:Uma2 family endonuclease [Enterovirga aerilata]|uniref:Uma2 family endonuclease n=1 Tax=Enterovirga aerilata TaxID=2730920 RepID=A0A849I3L2_9HYPH|nr:Uma2 family endonuclease [Enterovirga sp. DB1703]NNM74002.1 Uma2 family endonuclease [Enterovirga sp. DB1703]
MSARLSEADGLSREGFLAFLEDRPDEERWELFDGVPLMQASPRLDHQIIAFNLAKLIDAATAETDPSWAAVPQGMVDLTGVFPGNMYIPDVMVLDSHGVDLTSSYTAKCIVAAEVVSPSDRRRIGRGLGRKIEVKTERYRALPGCEAVLVVEQDRMEAVLHLRAEDGWRAERIEGPDAELSIPVLGLVCQLRELYLRTPLARTT